MSVISADQDFAARVLTEALDRFQAKFGWARTPAYEFLLGAALAWFVKGGESDARILEEVKKILAECRSSMDLRPAAPLPIETVITKRSG